MGQPVVRTRQGTTIFNNKSVPSLLFPTPHSCHVLLGTARSCLRMLGPMPGSCLPASPTSPSSTRRTSTRGLSASGTELGVWKHFQTDPLDRKSRIRTMGSISYEEISQKMPTIGYMSCTVLIFNSQVEYTVRCLFFCT